MEDADAGAYASSSSSSTRASVAALDPDTRTQRDIEAVISTYPDDEPTQIDAIAAVRGWFAAEDDAVRAYVQGETDLNTAVDRIAAPIDELYSTADHARALHQAEDDAVTQRPFCRTPVEAEERWGLPPQPGELPPAPAMNNSIHAPSTEGALWSLWYSVLHEAKRTPWYDRPGHQRLVDLVSALKARPNPPPPTTITKALRANWVWADDQLWSSLTMLGPAARESWNDSPGCGAGYTIPELHAWANVNAFVARLTKDGIADFWIYAIWALREALEEHVRDRSMLDALVPAAVVWLLIMGKELWERDEDLTPTNPNFGNPGMAGELYGGPAAFDKERWAFWKARLTRLQKKKELHQDTKDLIHKAIARMDEIEQTPLR